MMRINPYQAPATNVSSSGSATTRGFWRLFWRGAFASSCLLTGAVFVAKAVTWMFVRDLWTLQGHVLLCLAGSALLSAGFCIINRSDRQAFGLIVAAVIILGIGASVTL